MFLTLAALVCFVPSVSSGVALLVGMVIGLIRRDPSPLVTRRLIQELLPLAVMGLGAGMNLGTVAAVGLHGLGYTVLSISLTVALGLLLGRWIRAERNMSWLITIGTAICGGSAIAAVAPVIRARPHEITVSLAIIFILNAVALFVFPTVGHFFQLSEYQFGLWSALAIHDTSSVVGATLQYGERALQVGTTIKLARALWIVPVTFLTGVIFSRNAPADQNSPAPKRPWFILGFLIIAAIATWTPGIIRLANAVDHLAKRTLVFTLFLIGTTFSRETFKLVGAKPFLQGLILWLFVAVGSLSAIHFFAQ